MRHLRHVFLLVPVLAACELKKVATTGLEPDTSTTDSTHGIETSEPPTSTTSEGWALDECLTRFDWECGPEDLGCAPPQPIPRHECDSSMLCDEVEIRITDPSSDMYQEVVPEQAALCALQALRDRTQGYIRITWGDTLSLNGDDAFTVTATVYLLGDDTILMNWDTYLGCCASKTVFVSRRVALQPATYFEDCLVDSNTDKLIACFVGELGTFDVAPEGWLPPWTLGTCDEELPPSCKS